jgi:hypothetical protein
VGRALLDVEYTEDEVEQEVALCQETMSCILNTIAKKIRIWTQSQQWANANNQERRQGVVRER